MLVIKRQNFNINKQRQQQKKKQLEESICNFFPKGATNNQCILQLRFQLYKGLRDVFSFLGRSINDKH